MPLHRPHWNPFPTGGGGGTARKRHRGELAGKPGQRRGTRPMEGVGPRRQPVPGPGLADCQVTPRTTARVSSGCFALRPPRAARTRPRRLSLRLPQRPALSQPRRSVTHMPPDCNGLRQASTDCPRNAKHALRVVAIRSASPGRREGGGPRWHGRMPDPTAADAVSDRLVHGAYRLAIGGPMMKLRANAMAAEADDAPAA